MMANTTLTVDIEYHPEVVPSRWLGVGIDRLLETVLSTPGIMDEYGNPQIGAFFVTADGSCPGLGRRSSWKSPVECYRRHIPPTSRPIARFDYDTKAALPTLIAGSRGHRSVEIASGDGGSQLARVVELPTVSIDQIGAELAKPWSVGIAPSPESDLEVRRRWVLYTG